MSSQSSYFWIEARRRRATAPVSGVVIGLARVAGASSSSGSVSATPPVAALVSLQQQTRRISLFGSVITTVPVATTTAILETLKNSSLKTLVTSVPPANSTPILQSITHKIFLRSTFSITVPPPSNVDIEIATQVSMIQAAATTTTPAPSALIFIASSVQSYGKVFMSYASPLPSDVTAQGSPIVGMISKTTTTTHAFISLDFKSTSHRNVLFSHIDTTIPAPSVSLFLAATASDVTFSGYVDFLASTLIVSVTLGRVTDPVITSTRLSTAIAPGFVGLTFDRVTTAPAFLGHIHSVRPLPVVITCMNQTDQPASDLFVMADDPPPSGISLLNFLNTSSFHGKLTAADPVSSFINITRCTNTMKLVGLAEPTVPMNATARLRQASQSSIIDTDLISTSPVDSDLQIIRTTTDKFLSGLINTTIPGPAEVVLEKTASRVDVGFAGNTQRPPAAGFQMRDVTGKPSLNSSIGSDGPRASTIVFVKTSVAWSNLHVNQAVPIYTTVRFHQTTNKCFSQSHVSTTKGPDSTFGLRAIVHDVSMKSVSTCGDLLFTNFYTTRIP